MNTNKNSYTITYAAIMVVIVALLLALVSGALKEKQTSNVKLDKKETNIEFTQYIYRRRRCRSTLQSIYYSRNGC